MFSSVLRTIFHKKDCREKESNPKNIPHEEVFRGMQILWIDIESRIASAIRATKYEMLFERSEFIEWFEEFVYRAPSQDVFGTTFFFGQSSELIKSFESVIH